MWLRKRSSLSSHPKRSWRLRRIVFAIGLLAIVGAVAMSFFGRGFLARSSRSLAARQMSMGAISAAQQWLTWSAWFDPGDGTTDLMQAACFRHLEQVDGWGKALESAKRKGAPTTQIQQETKLGYVRSGEMGEGADNDVVALMEAGVSVHDVSAVFVHGYLVRGRPEKAEAVLEGWAAAYPQDGRVAYMKGVCWKWLGDPARAERELENALARQPRHELARSVLAKLFEEQHRVEEAINQYVEMASRSPASDTAKIGLARLLRKSGRLTEARTVLESLTSHTEQVDDVVRETGQIELESGNYQEAERWFEQADLDRTKDSTILVAAANTYALRGRITRAQRLLARLDAANTRSARSYDLRVRLAIDPNDKKAHEELLRQSPPSTTANTDVSETERAKEDQGESLAMSGEQLYELHCAACHGANGDGNGRAARYLFPRPRDLRAGSFRLLSTLNGVPTPGDVEIAIGRGMTGTSMRSFEDLSKEQRELLTREVLRLRRDGIRELSINILKDEGEEIDGEYVREIVELRTTPGDIVEPPQMAPPDARSIARGKNMYFELGCNKCHGDDGVGQWDVDLSDDKLRPTRPRDLVYEPFKGGQELDSIYLRVCVGMPGTPHPASCNLPEEQLVDLVHYCRSLSREPKRSLTNYQRANQATGRAYLSALGRFPTP